MSKTVTTPKIHNKESVTFDLELISNDDKSKAAFAVSVIPSAVTHCIIFYTLTIIFNC